MWNEEAAKTVFNRQKQFAEAHAKDFLDVIAKIDRALTKEDGFADPEIDPLIVLHTQVDVMQGLFDDIRVALNTEIDKYNEAVNKELDEIMPNIEAILEAFNNRNGEGE